MKKMWAMTVLCFSMLAVACGAADETIVAGDSAEVQEEEGADSSALEEEPEEISEENSIGSEDGEEAAENATEDSEETSENATEDSEESAENASEGGEEASENATEEESGNSEDTNEESQNTVNAEETEEPTVTEPTVEEPTVTEPTGPQNYIAEYRVEEGYLAPDFTANLSNGTTVNLSDFQGTPVILNFWASWCGPCCNEMPAFQWLTDEYGSNLTILAVNCGESMETIQNFASAYGYTFLMAADPNYDICNLYPTSGIPYTIVIDSYGVIRHITVGAADAQSMYNHYKECLADL